jgi:hypothetical protein
MWRMGIINGEYLANMEDVLDLYAQPQQEGITRLCFDECPFQLIGQVLMPIPPKPNSTKEEHQEYLRKGVSNVLLAHDILDKDI